MLRALQLLRNFLKLRKSRIETKRSSLTVGDHFLCVYSNIEENERLFIFSSVVTKDLEFYVSSVILDIG